MIVKVTQGGDPGPLTRYLVDKEQHLDKDRDEWKSRNAHTDPRLVAGSLLIDGELSRADADRLAEHLRRPSLAHPGVQVKDGPIWHCSLSIAAGERLVDNVEWGQISEEFMSKMGFTDSSKAGVRWVAVNHGVSENGNQHVHIAVNLIRDDGTKVDVWQSLKRASRTAGEIERAHGLTVLEGRIKEPVPVRAPAPGEWRQAQRHVAGIESRAVSATRWSPQLDRDARELSTCLRAAGRPREAQQVRRTAGPGAAPKRSAVPVARLLKQAVSDDPDARREALVAQMLVAAVAVKQARRATRPVKHKTGGRMTQADGLDDPIEAGVTVGGVAAAVAVSKMRNRERDDGGGVVVGEDLSAAEQAHQHDPGVPDDPARLRARLDPQGARQETTLPRGVPLLDGESADAYWDRTAPTESPKDRDPADWKSGDEPMSDRQRWALERKGIDVGAGMSKAQASLLISGDAAGAAAVAARPARSADVKNNGRRDGGVVRSESAADGPASVSQSALAAEKARAKFKGRGR